MFPVGSPSESRTLCHSPLLVTIAFSPGVIPLRFGCGGSLYLVLSRFVQWMSSGCMMLHKSVGDIYGFVHKSVKRGYVFVHESVDGNFQRELKAVPIDGRKFGIICATSIK